MKKNLKQKTIEAEKRCLALAAQLRASKEKTAKAQLQANEAQRYISALVEKLGGNVEITAEEYNTAKAVECIVDSGIIKMRIEHN